MTYSDGITVTKPTRTVLNNYSRNVSYNAIQNLEKEKDLDLALQVIAAKI